MPAIPADIGAASRDVVVVTWSDPVIAARYPASRDASVTPADGYFDSSADAVTVLTARGNLIGEERRRFTAVAMGLGWPTVSSSIPQALLIDAELGANSVHLAARLELDLEADTSTYELFG